MSQSIALKMHAIAKHVEDLTASGDVRAMTGNEKGYAKIFSVNHGCRVWAHHTRDDRLLIDLMITQSAAHRYGEAVKSAARTFAATAKDAGFEIKQRQWAHAIRSIDVRQQHYIDVTDKSINDVLALIDKVKTALRSAK
jgi:hypothetical protein